MRQRYIQSFNTAENAQAAIDNKELGKPYVAYIKDGQYIDWNEKSETDYSKMPLTFEIISGGTIIWRAQNTAYTTTIEYSLDSGETWTSITSNTGASAPRISVNDGDVVQFRGNNVSYGNNYNYNTFSGSTARFKVEGNIMSLIDSTGFATAITLASSYAFNGLFINCTGLTSAENLVLPATTLTDNCYDSMFYNCTSLTTAPVLPAETLANFCYQSMFQGCTSLTSAPELPATTLAQYCYQSMFQGCTSLTLAPELPATRLPSNCYRSMFSGCISLNNIKCLATDISATYSTLRWVKNVASTGTFVKHPNTTWTTGESGIPTGWTVVDATE